MTKYPFPLSGGQPRAPARGRAAGKFLPFFLMVEEQSQSKSYGLSF